MRGRQLLKVTQLGCGGARIQIQAAWVRAMFLKGACGLARRHRHNPQKGKGELLHLLNVSSCFGD